MVRAEIDTLERCARTGERRFHPVGELLKIGFRVVASANAGLIGDDHERVARILECSGGLEDARHPLEFVDLVHVAVVDVDDAVPIEKCGAAHHRTPFGYSTRSLRM